MRLLHAVTRSDASARCTPSADAKPDARVEAAAPQGLDAALLDVDELEDTQPSFLAPYLDEEFFDAPTQPDLRVHLGGATDDQQWERVLRAVAEAVRRVFANQTS
jgi:hypothetical protein